MSNPVRLAYTFPHEERESDAGPISSEGLCTTSVHGWLAVEQDDEATFLDPESLAMIELAGRRVVPLAEIWLAAEPLGRLSELHFHFTGEDGFDTREESAVGMPALLLEHAFVDAVTRDLVWTIDVPPEFAVRAVAAITVQHSSEVPTLEIAAE